MTETPALAARLRWRYGWSAAGVVLSALCAGLAAAMLVLILG